jgi:hypothetical protein
MRQTWKDNKGFISNNYNTQWGAMLNYTVFLLLTTSKLATSLKTKGINIKPLGVIPHTPTLGVCSLKTTPSTYCTTHTHKKKLHQYKRPFKTGAPTTPTPNNTIPTKTPHQYCHIKLSSMEQNKHIKPLATQNIHKQGLNQQLCVPTKLQTKVVKNRRKSPHTPHRQMTRSRPPHTSILYGQSQQHTKYSHTRHQPSTSTKQSLQM